MGAMRPLTSALSATFDSWYVRAPSTCTISAFSYRHNLLTILLVLRLSVRVPTSHMLYSDLRMRARCEYPRGVTRAHPERDVRRHRPERQVLLNRHCKARLQMYYGAHPLFRSVRCMAVKCRSLPHDHFTTTVLSRSAGHSAACSTRICKHGP